MNNTAPQIQIMAAGETRNCAVSFAGKLDVNELLTGTPTVVEDTKSPSSATSLTLSNKVVSTTVLTINDLSVPIAEAVQFAVTGGSSGGEYIIKVTVSTNSSPAQTLVGYEKLHVRAE